MNCIAASFGADDEDEGDEVDGGDVGEEGEVGEINEAAEVVWNGFGESRRVVEGLKREGWMVLKGTAACSSSCEGGEGLERVGI